MIDRFESLLGELSKISGLTFHTDHQHFCALQIKKGLIVQMQPDKSEENLLIISKIGEIPAGKFREDVLKDALKANRLNDLKGAIFAYLPTTSHLVLFQTYPFDSMNGEKLATILSFFIETVENWKNAILSGRSSPLGTV